MPKYLTFASLVLALLSAGCSTRLAQAPDKLRPASSETLAMIVPAKGVQVYECRALKDRVGAYEWAFVGPEAELFDLSGKSIGRHYGGPHWEARDGSKTLGALKARADAPIADAIPWLLLGAKSVGGDGQFSKITSIQRVNTVGGTSPQRGCSEDMAGAIIRIPYTADYYFFSAK